MSFKEKAVVVALMTTIAAPVPAWAFGGGGGGCSDLPEYYRAQGALQGMTSSCDMTIEEARRIIAQQDGSAAVYPQVAPAPLVHHRHRKARTLQPY